MRPAALALACAATAVARPRASSFIPRWSDGLTWKVEYSAVEPGAAGVADPAGRARVEVWVYRLKRHEDDRGRLDGWDMTVTPERGGDERYEIRWTPYYAVVKVAHSMRLQEGYEVRNDAEPGSGYRSDSTDTPLLDMPPMQQGRLEDKGWVIELRRPGYDGYTETFHWERKKPWWTKAQRSYGRRGTTARLLD